MSSLFNIQIQNRDVDLMVGLFESRVMTLAHAAVLYFDGSAEAAKKRVQKLKSAGFIAERPRRRYEASVLHLTHRAFDLLIDRRKLDHYPALAWESMEKRARVSPMTITHELSVMDFKCAMVQAMRLKGERAVTNFQTWPLLYAFRASPGRGKPIWVRPDGFFRVDERADLGGINTSYFYIEIDRSTETHDTLCRRAASYRDHYRSGDFASSLGRAPDEYAQSPFRVLFLLQNAERRNNMAVALLRSDPPVMTQIWLGVLPQVLADPLGPVWMRPVDYLTATRGTRFDPAEPEEPFYRRRPEREAFIAHQVRNITLF